MLRWGGYLDTMVDGRTGVFFDRAEPEAIRAALQHCEAAVWDPEAIRSHAETFGEDRFVHHLRIQLDELRSAKETPR